MTNTLSRENDENKQGLIAALSKNHRQWAVVGSVGPLFMVAAWFWASFGEPRGDALGMWGFMFCSASVLCLPVRAIVSLIDRDGWRVFVLFAALAAANGLSLLVVLQG